jgi:hypothetical protein
MTVKAPQKENRKKDPYLDRRSGEDRREAYDIDYFADGGAERRQDNDRRQPKERRKDCVKVSKWSSVCTGNNPKKSND